MNLTDLPTSESPVALEDLNLGRDKKQAFRVVDAVGIGATVVGVGIAGLAKTAGTRWSIIIASAAASFFATARWKDRIANDMSKPRER